MAMTKEEKTKKQTQYKRRWNEKHYKQLNVQIEFALYDKIVEEAKNRGIPVRQYVISKLLS